MLKIIVAQAPDKSSEKGVRLFIAGGISNCPKWQDELIEKLQNESRLKDEVYEDEDIKIIISNPRCKEVPEEKAQIKWEFEELKDADIISFWFSEGSLNPITLLEYGLNLRKSKKIIVVGSHPDYIKKNNVIFQTELYNSKIKINESFESFYEELVEELICKITNYRISHLPKLFNN